MRDEQELRFGPFRLDPANARLWHGSEALRVSPKALAVLHYLVEHAGRLVTKDDLSAAVWPGVVVGEAALTICIGELRKVLGERAKAPQYIETVHKWGYRFIASFTTAPPVLRFKVHGPSPAPNTDPGGPRSGTRTTTQMVRENAEG